VHVPFCASRCDYCAFATWTDRAHLMDAYLDAVATRSRRFHAEGGPPATSVFFGGGTPSLVPAVDLMRVLAAIDRTDDAEVTVECNPDTVTDELLTTYLEGGVDAAVVRGAVDGRPRAWWASAAATTWPTSNGPSEAARRAGFRSFNLDLIYGGSGESVDDWRLTLERVVALDPPHVSAYALTIEAGTPLAADVSRSPPTTTDQADKYLLADELLGRAGLEWYEISNWARPGFACRHNLLYWLQGDYAASAAPPTRTSPDRPVVERAHARPLRRRDAIGRFGRGRSSGSTTRPVASRGCSSPWRMARACRRRRCRTTRASLGHLVDRRGNRAT